MYALSPSTPEAETGGSLEFKTSLVYSKCQDIQNYTEKLYLRETETDRQTGIERERNEERET